MDIASYFGLIQYTLMAVTFVVLVLIFIHVFFGKEEKTE